MSTNGNDKKNEARNLYFQSALTQTQIAELIGVSQKTISLWINDGKWKLLKDRTEQSPVIFIEQMISELQELHQLIASRPHGQRFPSTEEAETRRKILLSIKYMQEQQSVGVHAEVITHFISFVSRHSTDDAKLLVVHADKYLRGEKDFAPQEQYKKYIIPGDICMPGNPLPPSSGDNVQPSGAQDLDKAA